MNVQKNYLQNFSATLYVQYNVPYTIIYIIHCIMYKYILRTENILPSKDVGNTSFPLRLLKIKQLGPWL